MTSPGAPDLSRQDLPRCARTISRCSIKRFGPGKRAMPEEVVRKAATEQISRPPSHSPVVCDSAYQRSDNYGRKHARMYCQANNVTVSQRFRDGVCYLLDNEGLADSPLPVQGEVSRRAREKLATIAVSVKPSKAQSDQFQYEQSQ
jgi:hypothetical protein